MTNETCTSTRLAACEYGSVTACPDCKMFHLHIGPLSLRLHEEVFMDLARMMSDLEQARQVRSAQPDLHLVTP